MWPIACKLAGALLVVCAGGAAGVCAGRGRVRSARDVQRLARCLAALEDALRFQKGDTAQLLRCAAQAAGLPLGEAALDGAQPMPQRVHCALEALEKRMDAPRAECAIFSEAVLGLCVQDESEARRALAWARRQLDARAQEAAQSARVQRRLYRALGLAAGAACALLLA